MRLIRLHNIRRGLATNSSSSHSMIRKRIEVHPLQENNSYDFSEDHSITLHTRVQKRRYLAAQLWDNRYRLWTEEGRYWPGLNEINQYDQNWQDTCIRTILEICDLPEEEAWALRNSSIGDLSGGVFTHGRHGFEVPRAADGGPEREWLTWALSQCDDPEVIITDEYGIEEMIIDIE